MAQLYNKNAVNSYFYLLPYLYKLHTSIYIESLNLYEYILLFSYMSLATLPIFILILSKGNVYIF